MLSLLKPTWNSLTDFRLDHPGFLYSISPELLGAKSFLFGWQIGIIKAFSQIVLQFPVNKPWDGDCPFVRILFLNLIQIFFIS